ncbi:uncharacterized protein LOC132502420 [Mesoplodon densirostris]|uniref:uncharacterized protein LOC132502420 n=1 Tax=Mesoplodon densirostris TaxID=48708 RepID=UPI0028DC2127|nr:uncharacterized protein LOC132502420 [Mesoplodon densirostris]
MESMTKGHAPFIPVGEKLQFEPGNSQFSISALGHETSCPAARQTDAIDRWQLVHQIECIIRGNAHDTKLSGRKHNADLQVALLGDGDRRWWTYIWKLHDVAPGLAWGGHSLCHERPSNPLLCAKCCSRLWGPSRERDRNEYIPVPALKESLVKETDTQTCHENPGLGVSVSSVTPSSSSSSSTSTPIYQTPMRTFCSLSLNSPTRARSTLTQTHGMMAGIYSHSSGGKLIFTRVPFNQQIRERGRKKSKLFLVHAEGGWMEEKLQWIVTLSGSSD